MKSVSNGEERLLRTIDVTENGTIIVEQIDKGDDVVRMTSMIGGSGMIQHMSRDSVGELIGTLCELAGIDMVYVERGPMRAVTHNETCERENKALLYFQHRRALTVTHKASEESSDA